MKPHEDSPIVEAEIVSEGTASTTWILLAVGAVLLLVGVVFVAVFASLVFVGVSGPGESVSTNIQLDASQDAPEDGSTRVERENAFATDEFSIPALEPRPLIWIEDWWAIETELPAERERAQKSQSTADLLKAAERFDEAERYYLEAMEADPSWSMPPYQLACNFELSGDHERAVPQFAKAIELGFDDFPTVLTDDELGLLREQPIFHGQLRVIRQRYIQASKARVGQPIAVRPTGSKPEQGWPTILLLHGYGDTNISYLDNARAWAELGFLAVAVPGSVPHSDDRYAWSQDSIQQTHSDLQAALASPELVDRVNPRQVFLLGFSQGALHAMLLAAEEPRIYAGVVGLSPGGSLARQLVQPQIRPSERPSRVMFIHGTDEPHGPIVDIWAEACRTAGWTFDSRTHDGGHHFPVDWDGIRPSVARFLVDDASHDPGSR